MAGGKPPKPRRRRLRLLAWIALAILLLPLGLVGLLLAGLQTQTGRDLLRDIVVAQASGPDLALRIGRIAGAPPGRIVIEDLAVADAGGVWLESDRLELDWSPLALFSATLDVSRLEATRIEVARLPAGEPEPEPADQAPFELPTLPLEIRLDRLQVGSLDLGAPVLGEPLDVTIEGALAAERQGLVESRLEVAERAGEGSVEAEAVYRLADRNLSVSLHAAAPDDGRVSWLSGLPGAPPLSFRLEGEGPLPGWRADWHADAAPVATVDGQLGLDSLQPLSLTLSARATPGADFPAEIATWLKPVLELELAADYDSDAETAKLVLKKLSSDALSINGEADALLADDSADVNLSLRLRDPASLHAFVPELSLSGATFDVTAEKRGQTARLTVQGNVERPVFAGNDDGSGAVGFEAVELNLESGKVRIDDPLAGDADDPVHLAVTARDPRGDPALATLLDRTTTLDLVAVPGNQAIRLDRLELASGSLHLNASGHYGVAGDEAGRGQVTARLEHDDLSRLSALAGAQLGGRVTAALDGRLQKDGSGAVRLVVEPRELALGIPAAQALLGTEPLLSIEAERTAAGPVRLVDAELTGASLATGGQERSALRLNLEGTLSPTDETLDATASLALPDLAVLQGAGLPLAGSATLDLSAFGPLTAPQAVWAVRGQRLAYQGQGVETLSIDGTTAGLPDEPAGHVDLDAATAAGPLAGSFDYALEGDTARLDSLSLVRGNDSLSGSLAAHLPSGTASGELELALSDMSAYRSLIGQTLGGSVNARVALEAPSGTQGATVAARARDLRFEELRLGSLDLQARGRNLTGQPALDATVTAEGLDAGDVALSRLTTRVGGTLAALDVETSLQGTLLNHPLVASAAAQLGLAEATRVRLTSLDATLAEEKLALRSPSEILIAGNRTRVNGLDLAVAEGRVALDADLQASRVEAALQADGLPLRLVALVAPDLDPQGTLDFSVQLNGSPPRPQGTLSLVGSGLKVSAVAEDVPPLDLRLDGRLSAGRLTAQGHLGGFADEPLTLTADLPLLVTTTPPSASLPATEPISIDADWQGRLEPVVALLPIDAVRFGGRSVIDLSLRGSLDQPTASGKVSVEEGFYENYLLGLSLRPVSLELSGRGQRLELEKFEGRDSEGGRLNAEGFVDLSGDVPRFDLTLKADNAHLVQRDDVAGALDADLSVEGSTQGANLAGTIRTRPFEIRLIDALPPSVTELEVVEVHGGPAEASPEPPEEDAASPGVEGLRWLALNVDIDLPGKIFVRGRGLDSEWRGTFQVGGTAEQPRIQGRLSPVRGSFDFAGRVFTLSPDSSIQFLGSATPDPELDLTATYEGSELTANILIYGSVSDPQFELTSSPQLPEDEILARVLFGKSSGQLSASEAIQLAQAAQTLQGGGEGLMGIARRTLGVDVLTFAPGSSEDDLGALRIGEYVADGVFVGAEQGTTPGSSKAIVEWELTPNITIESEVGSDSNSNASVNWKWDY